MDTSEQIACEYLRHRFKSVVYEPDGNIPPDFLADGRVAVEVRRLNQNENTRGWKRGLEETIIPLIINFRKLTESLGPPVSNKSWFVFFQFKRPIDRWQVLEPIIRDRLLAFRDNPSYERLSIPIAPNFKIHVFTASKAHSTFFLLGGFTDLYSGGWFLAEMEKNLKICINEKGCKISSVRRKYLEWWLVLIDHIGHGLDDLDRREFHDQVRVEHDWDKVILLDPTNQKRAFEN